MTEAEWLACETVRPMFRHLRIRCDYPDFQFHLRAPASERKLRLVAAAFCRQVWHLLEDARSRSAVEAGERVAAGDCPVSDLDAARASASAAKKAASIPAVKAA